MTFQRGMCDDDAEHALVMRTSPMVWCVYLAQMARVLLLQKTTPATSTARAPAFGHRVGATSHVVSFLVLSRQLALVINVPWISCLRPSCGVGVV